MVNDSGESTAIRQIQETRNIAQELHRSLSLDHRRSVLLHACRQALSRCTYTIAHFRAIRQ
ncbi:MAG TPA: hypothetical protein VGN15_15360 [Ktedonobacteraceae bacterium]|nr:hypothetical protein [Ktedonobacteraceae bacterium]